MRSQHSAPAFSTLAPMPSGVEHPEFEMRRADPEWTISEVSRAFGLTLRALRFYESKGLIAPRRFGGARFYTSRDRARLKLVLAAKQMGFTLSETASMLGRAADNPNEDLPLSAETVQSQITFLEGQRSAIDGALSQLRERLDDMQAA